MGKYSSMERVARDFYPTPRAAILPLIPFLTGIQRFVEPCAGDYRLAQVLEEDGGLECVFASDIEPQNDEVCKRDALEQEFQQFLPDAIITNCPWDRDILHKMIIHFATQAPTWLLIDSNWSNTKQSAEIIETYCTHILPIGRVKWIEGSKGAGKEDASWYRFHAQKLSPTVFLGRNVDKVA